MKTPRVKTTRVKTTRVKTTRLKLAALLAFCPSSLLAQQEAPAPGANGSIPSLEPGIATASRVTDPPTIDGRLDDAAWQQAAPLTDFTQREPRDGQPASERTEVRVVFDDEALYVGVWAWDSQPDGIVPGERIRDYQVDESDNVVLILDTYKDEQNGFVFGTTPAGIEYDGQVANEGQGGGRFLGGGFNNRRRFQSGAGAGFNKNWDGSWSVATFIDERGWYAEFRIPFNTLRYGAQNDSWGFNVSRRVRRLNEESFWSPVPREFNLYRLNYAGDLEGLSPPVPAPDHRHAVRVDLDGAELRGRRDVLPRGRRVRRRGEAADHAGADPRHDREHRLRPGRGG